MKPDLLITQIKHCDYPLWRKTLAKHRDFFGKIIIYFSEHNRFPYFDHHIQDSLKNFGNVIFLDPTLTDWGTEDWRNHSTNEMLKYSTSEWVCSVEQDWFDKDWKKTLDIVEKASQNADLIGWGSKSGAKQFYIHPAFWFMKREALEKTRKDFSAKDGEDHFGLITRDAEALGLNLFDIDQDGGLKCDFSTEADCFHAGGINQNFLNGTDRQFVFHREEFFYVYNHQTIKAEGAQSLLFIEICKKIEERLKPNYPNFDPGDNEWLKFLP